MWVKKEDELHQAIEHIKTLKEQDEELKEELRNNLEEMKALEEELLQKETELQKALGAAGAMKDITEQVKEDEVNK